MQDLRELNSSHLIHERAVAHILVGFVKHFQDIDGWKIVLQSKDIDTSCYKATVISVGFCTDLSISKLLQP